MEQNTNSATVLHYVLTGLFIILLAILQTTVLRGIQIFHVIPNLLLIMTVSYSLTHGSYRAFFVGILCGLLLDLFGGRTIGMNTLLFALIVYFCVFISDSLFSNNAFVSMVFVFFLTIPYELLTYLFYFVIWNHGAFGFAIFSKILPAALYNFLFTLVLYPLVKRVTSIGIY